MLESNYQRKMIDKPLFIIQGKMILINTIINLLVENKKTN